ncbi:hypothetical protein QMN93_26060, partial [Enterobacter sp. R-1.6.2]|uniref:hypothetical protein n=1 Tax=Enterobacter sp. R-1.6.2 TaxID=3046185 RepID=UPI002B23F7E8
WLIRLLILGSGYNTMISHLGLIRTFLSLTQRGDSILSIAIEIRMAKLHELIEPLTEEQLMQLIHLSDVLYNASRSFNS